MKQFLKILCLAAAIVATTYSCEDKDLSQRNTNPPSAVFTTDKAAYLVGETVHFSNQSVVTESPIKSYYWHFGFDGQDNNSLEQNPTFAYSRVGKYVVRLTVTDEKGAYATAVDTILVVPDNQPPRAAFTYTPQIVIAGQAVQFTNTSTDDDGTVVSYAWDFGNGQSSVAENPTTTYDAAGFYTVSLRVTDNQGATASVATSIMVQASAGNFGDIRWIKEYESSSSIAYTSPAVGPNGDVYVTSNTRKIYAMSPIDGAIKWSFDLASGNDIGGGDQNSSPMAGPDGTVYIATGSAVTTPAGGGMYALNPVDGSLKWYYFVWGGANIVFTSPVLALDGNILIANRGTNGRMHKVDVTDGKRLWQQQPLASGANYNTVVDKNGVSYSAMNGQTTGIGTATNNGIDRATPDGARITPAFGKTTPNESVYGKGLFVRNHTALDDNMLYVASFAGFVAAYNTVSTTDEPAWITSSYNKIDYSGIAVAANEATIYVGTYEDAASRLLALNKNSGALRWSYTADANITSCPAVDANGVIHFADEKGNWYALNSDGSLKNKQKIGDQIRSSPVIADYGILYFTVVENGACKLVAIDINAGPADSPWPQAGQNARRDGLQK